MSAKPRQQQQHRATREGKRAREVADLKRENHRLQRQNARLRKEVTRVVDSNNMFEGLDVTSTTVVAEGGTLTAEVLHEAHARIVAAAGGPQTRAVPPGICPQCGDRLRRLDVPKADGSSVTIDACPGCRWRHKVDLI